MGAALFAGGPGSLLSDCSVCKGVGVDASEWILCFDDPCQSSSLPSKASADETIDPSKGRTSKGGRRRRPKGANTDPGQEVCMQRLEDLTRELFRLHDLNGNGLLEEIELIKLNEKIAILHHGKDTDKAEVRSKYRELFRTKLDPNGRPVPYEIFRRYAREYLDGFDADPEAQEMILEQFVAEAQSGRRAFGLPSLVTESDLPFTGLQTCSTTGPAGADAATSLTSSKVSPSRRVANAGTCCTVGEAQVSFDDCPVLESGEEGGYAKLPRDESVDERGSLLVQQGASSQCESPVPPSKALPRTASDDQEQPTHGDEGAMAEKLHAEQRNIRLAVDIDYCDGSTPTRGASAVECRFPAPGAEAMAAGMAAGAQLLRGASNGSLTAYLPTALTA